MKKTLKNAWESIEPSDELKARIHALADSAPASEPRLIQSRTVSRRDMGIRLISGAAACALICGGILTVLRMNPLDTAEDPEGAGSSLTDTALPYDTTALTDTEMSDVTDPVPPITNEYGSWDEGITASMKAALPLSTPIGEFTIESAEICDGWLRVLVTTEVMRADEKWKEMFGFGAKLLPEPQLTIEADGKKYPLLYSTLCGYTGQWKEPHTDVRVEYVAPVKWTATEFTIRSETSSAAVTLSTDKAEWHEGEDAGITLRAMPLSEGGLTWCYEMDASDAWNPDWAASTHLRPSQVTFSEGGQVRALYTWAAVEQTAFARLFSLHEPGNLRDDYVFNRIWIHHEVNPEEASSIVKLNDGVQTIFEKDGFVLRADDIRIVSGVPVFVPDAPDSEACTVELVMNLEKDFPKAVNGLPVLDVTFSGGTVPFWAIDSNGVYYKLSYVGTDDYHLQPAEMPEELAGLPLPGAGEIRVGFEEMSYEVWGQW